MDRRARTWRGLGEPVDVKRLQVAYSGRCAILGVRPLLDPVRTTEEQAARLVPHAAPPRPAAGGPGGGPGGGGGAGGAAPLQG